MAARQLGQIQPLRGLLLEIGNMDVNHEHVRGWLFLPKDREQLTLESPAVILPLNEVPPELEDDEEAETPELARNHQLKRFLSGADIQGIIDNARQQKSDVDLAEIFSAIMYYHEFDAYKNISA